MSAQESDWLADAPAPANRGGRPPKRAGKSTCRSLKVECVGCGCIAYMSATAIARAGAAPSCGCGAGTMSTPGLDRREHVEREQESAEARRYERRFTANSLGVKPPKHCAELGCVKFVRGEFCAEHGPRGAAASETFYVARAS